MKEICLRYLAAFSLTFILGCSTSDENVDNNTMGALRGEWVWTKSTGSIAGVTVTPEIVGKSMIIEFSDDAVFKKYIDNEEVYESPFILNIEEEKTKIQFTTWVDYIPLGFGLDHQVEQEIEFITEDRLHMIDPCCDNFVFEFVKKP